MHDNKVTLDVREIVLESYGSVWVHRWDIVRISWMWVFLGVIIAAALHKLSGVDEGGTLGLFYLLMLPLFFYPWASIASAWHQVQRKDGNAFVPSRVGFHAYALNYIVPMFVLALLMMTGEFLDAEGSGSFGVLFIFIVVLLAYIFKPLRLPLVVFVVLGLFYAMSFLPMLFASPALLSEYSNGLLSAGQVTLLGELYSVFAKAVSYIWPLWLFSLVGLILPARAFGDKKYSFLQAKSLVYGHKKQLFLAMLIAELPLYAFLSITEEHLDSGVWWLIGTCVFLLMSFVSLSVLTYSYQALVLDKNALDNKVQKT